MLRRLFLWIIVFCPAILFSIPFVQKEPLWNSDQLHDLWGFRKKMGEHGIYVLPNYVQDLDWPTTGGFKTTNYPLYLFLFSLQFGVDFEQLMGAKGLIAYLDFLVHAGQEPTRNFVRDFQVFDNLEAFSLVQLAELWVQKNFFGGKCDIRLGKIDAYGVFIDTPFAQVLLNNSYSQFPTILGYPSYPSPAVGIILNMRPFSWITLRASIFDGSVAQGLKTGNLGAKLFFQNLGKHVLFLNEVNFKWAQKNYFGELILGLWGINGRINNFSGGASGKSAGPFGSISQTLWKQKDLKTERAKTFKPSFIGAFGQWGYANQKVAPAKFFISGGLEYRNVVKKFKDDSISIGATTVYFSQSAGSPFRQTFETALEATYQFSFYKGTFVQPDLQWIIQPGGLGRKNALVASLRISVSL